MVRWAWSSALSCIYVLYVRVPTYEEVVGLEDEGQPDDSEDEEALEKQEEFERKFNFRFEEPGAELVRKTCVYVC